MTPRLVILTEIIAPYRIPVFNSLARNEAIELHVIFLAETDATLRQWRVYKEEIQFSYQVLPSRRRRLLGHNILLNRGLKDALRQANPDVVVCGGYNYLASWQAQSWARSHQVPFILWLESTERDRRSRNPLARFLKTRFIRDCGAFIVPGKSSLEYVRGFGIAENAIFSAPNAVDIDFFSRQAVPVRRDAAMQRKNLQLPSRFFLFVGRLVHEKGVFDLLEAYGKLKPELRAEIGLVLAGEGTAGSELARRAKQIVPGCVQFAGFAQREQVASYYALADVFVFPSHSDPWGLVVNEAMACSLPVISSEAAGCTADLVSDNWNGRVVRSGDVGQLMSAMEDLACDSALRLLMGQRSGERIMKFSPQLCAAGIANAARSCATEARGARRVVSSDHASR